VTVACELEHFDQDTQMLRPSRLADTVGAANATELTHNMIARTVMIIFFMF